MGVLSPLHIEKIVHYFVNLVRGPTSRLIIKLKRIISQELDCIHPFFFIMRNEIIGINCSFANFHQKKLIMRNFTMSFAAFALGAIFVVSQNGFSFSTITDTTIPLSIQNEASAVLKVQQAHLRTIDPFEIDIVPTSRPVPKGIPLGSMFGMRKHPILNVDKMHKGIDFPAPEGTPVLATATGRVGKMVGQRDSSTYGMYIMLLHDEEYATLYAHLSDVLVDVGEIVEEGDTIGLVGSTGRSTNPHLHYEVLKDGLHMDPEDFF
jgi:murein DD-endopeptidase MepM/ murein hydrolase activator NlpD